MYGSCGASCTTAALRITKPSTLLQDSSPTAHPDSSEALNPKRYLGLCGKPAARPVKPNSAKKGSMTASLTGFRV